MSATLDEPFLLSSHALPSKVRSGKQPESSRNVPQPVYASYSKPKGAGGGMVTIGAQGDGIHTFDLSGLHPSSSYVVGPSTTFVCAPSTSSLQTADERIQRTHALIGYSQDVSADEEGRILWHWDEKEGSNLGTSDRNTTIIPHTAQHIFSPEALGSDLVFVSAKCEFTWADAELVTRHSWSPSTTNELLEVFCFDRQSTVFCPAHLKDSPGPFFLICSLNGGYLQLQPILLGNGEFIVPEALSVSSYPEGIMDVSCSPSGQLTVLTRTGLWRTYTIDCRNAAMSISRSPESLRLKGLSFVQRKKGQVQRDAKPFEASLLSLGSSFVLLSGVTDSTEPEIALLLWDIQYGVLLDSRMLPIPSTLPKSTPAGVRVSLVPATSSQVLLLLWPAGDLSKSQTSSKGGLRSSVFVVPVNVPRTSSLANVIGRAAKGTRWIAEETESTSLPNGNHNGETADDKDRRAVLEAINEALEEERPEVADTAFFEWVERTNHKLKDKKVDPPSVPNGIDGDPEKTPWWKEGKFIIGQAFASELLRLALRIGEPDTAKYSPKIVRYLLEKQAVSHSMVEGGLTAALIAHGDWENIPQALRRVTDIPEDDLLRILHVCVKHQLEKAPVPAESDSMAVDHATYAIPGVRQFLAACLSYPVSPPALRVAIRKHFSVAEELVFFLVQLETWLHSWTTKDLRLPLEDIEVDPQGATKLSKKLRKAQRRRAENLPDLENILLYTQAILDSSFVTLVQHPPCHKILQRLSKEMSPQVTLNNELEMIRGSLEPFAKAQARTVADAKGGRKKDAEVDWRKRRKALQEQNSIAIGLYQLEELTF